MMEMTSTLPGAWGRTPETCNPNSEDLMFVQQVQQGNLAAYNELVARYQDQVYRQAYWILGEEQAADDAAQEAFCRGYVKIQTFNGQSFRAWILRITTNYCLDQIRWKKCHALFSLESFSKEPDEDNENNSRFWDPQPTPEQIVEQAEMTQSVIGCLMNLPVEYRLPILLIDVDEMNYQEAAQIIGINLGSFKSRLFRARAKLLEAIKQIPNMEVRPA
jgi:RNA polymerase sigma-70 factor, ECF subfamily